MDIEAKIRAMPKVELHRHLSGAVSSEAMYDIARKLGLSLEEEDREAFLILTSMYRTDKGFHHFLEKFRPRARYYKDRRLVSEVTRSVIQDAARDNIIYLELRFSASHFSREMGFDREEISEQIISIAREEAQAADMKVGFLMTLTRDLTIEENCALMDIALHSRLAEYFVGIDIAGDEDTIPLSKLEICIKETIEHGKRLTIHAGEAGPAANVSEAIDAGALRIGHGVHSFHDMAIVNTARDRGVCYEVCPTSNIDTMTINGVAELEISRLLQERIALTINTDDPGISTTTLSDELIIIQRTFDLTIEDLIQLQRNGISAAFLDEETKTELHGRLDGFAAA
ncbi:adenosine deaminase [Planctomycetota bacterium]